MLVTVTNRYKDKGAAIGDPGDGPTPHPPHTLPPHPSPVAVLGSPMVSVLRKKNETASLTSNSNPPLSPVAAAGNPIVSRIPKKMNDIGFEIFQGNYGNQLMTQVEPTITLNPQPQTLNPQPSTLNPKSQTLIPKPYTRKPKPYTLNPKS